MLETTPLVVGFLLLMEKGGMWPHHDRGAKEAATSLWEARRRPESRAPQASSGWTAGWTASRTTIAQLIELSGCMAAWYGCSVQPLRRSNRVRPPTRGHYASRCLCPRRSSVPRGAEKREMDDPCRSSLEKTRDVGRRGWWKLTAWLGGLCVETKEEMALRPRLTG